MHGKNKKIVCIFISEDLAALNSAKVTKNFSETFQELFKMLIMSDFKNSQLLSCS